MQSDKPEASTAKKNMPRRKFVAAVGASGAGASLAGCLWDGDEAGDGPEGEDIDDEVEEEDTVIQWHGGHGDGEGDEVKDRVREALWDAGLPEDIFVEIQDTPETTDELLDQYNTWLSAERNEPHLMNFDSGWTIPFIVRGQIQSMEEVLSDEQLEEVEEHWFEASLDSVRDEDGELYGLPYFPDLGVMHYRKDLIEDAGYDTDDWATNPISWEEFSEIAADVAEQNSDEIDYGYTFQADNYEGLSCCNFNEWISTMGGAFFGDPNENLFGPVNDRPITVNEEEVVDTINMIKTFVYGNDHEDALDEFEGGFTSEDNFGFTEPTSETTFLDGNAVFHRNWTYVTSMAARDPDDVDDDNEPAFGDDYGAMPIPYGIEPDEAEWERTGGTAAALGGWNIVVNPNLEDEDVQEAIPEFLDAVMSPEFQIFQFTDPNIGNIPIRTDVLDSDEARDEPVIGDHVDTILEAGENMMPRPVTTAWPDQSSAIADQVNAALRDEKSAQEAMDDLHEQIGAIEEELADD